MTALDKQREYIAGIIGEDPEAITTTDPRWVEMMQEGVLVSLHIGRWRAKKQLSWEDLGIRMDEKAEDELKNIINLGHKKLLPAKVLREFDAIESAARKWLEKKSYNTHWGRFLPVTAYQEWKEKNEEYCVRYFAAADELIRDYDEVIRAVLYGYRIAAGEAYDRLKVLHPDSVRKFKSRAAFVETFVSNIRASLETPERIREDLRFEVELNYIPLPTLLAEDWAEQQRIKDQAAIEHAQAEADQRIEYARAHAEEEKQAAEIRLARSAAEHKEALMREMHQDVVEEARRKKEKLVDGFLKDVVIQLRAMVYNSTVDVLGAIKKHDHIHPRSVVQLKNMVEQVQSLNFYGDEEVERMVAKVKPYLEQDNDARSLGDITGTMQDIATVIRASLIDLGEKPRQSRKLAEAELTLGDLGIVDEPAGDMLRQARYNLGLEDEDVAELPVRQERML